MWAKLVKLIVGVFGGKIVKSLIIAALTSSFGYLAYSKYKQVDDAFDKAAMYDAAVIARDAAIADRDRATQMLLNQVAEHAVDIARREQVRQTLADDRKKILKAAQIEGGKYRELKRRMKDVETWGNNDVPGSVNRLYNGQEEPSGEAGLRSN